MVMVTTMMRSTTVFVYMLSVFILSVTTVVIPTTACPTSCKCTGTTTDCSNLGLTDIPSDIPTTTTVLKLNGNNLVTIDDNSFNGLNDLIDLYLNKNQINEVKVSAFSGLGNLQNLHLQNNQIETLPGNVFKGLASLIRLDLYSNQISELQGTVFRDLTNLVQLYLNNNQLVTLPQDIFLGLRKLERISLHSNKIYFLGKRTFKNADSLKYLHLDRNEITGLPGDIFATLHELLHLYLQSNMISVLPETVFQGLNNLQLLHIYKNGITALPGNVFDGLTRLQQLHLYENTINSLPDEIFAGLSKLQQLYIDRNQLSCLPQKVFNGMAMLQELHLYRNNITILPEDLFNGLINLKSLYIDGNTISHLPGSIFSGLTNLTELTVNSNKLRTLQVDIFEGLQNLRLINLCDNLITTLPGSIFSDLPNLLYLYLGNNPWSCDCRLQELNEWLDNNRQLVSYSSDMLCASPEEHEGRKLKNVTSDEMECYSFPVFYAPYTETDELWGTNVILDCDVTGIPTPEKTWVTPKGTVVSSNVQGTLETCYEDNIIQMADGSLFIPSLTDELTGVYTCLANNIKGSAAGARSLDILLNNVETVVTIDPIIHPEKTSIAHVATTQTMYTSTELEPLPSTITTQPNDRTTVTPTTDTVPTQASGGGNHKGFGSSIETTGLVGFGLGIVTGMAILSVGLVFRGIYKKKRRRTQAYEPDDQSGTPEDNQDETDRLNVQSASTEQLATTDDDIRYFSNPALEDTDSANM